MNSYIRKKLFFTLFTLDVLCGFYLKPIAFTLSMMPASYWNINNIKKLTRLVDGIWQLALFFLCTLSVLISLIYGAFAGESTIDWPAVWQQNITYLFILAIFFFYYNYLRFLVEKELIIKCLKIYLALNFFLAILFFLDYNLYFKVRDFWSLGALSESVGEFSSITRFTGIVGDPNNSSIAIVAIYASILVSEKFTPAKFLFYFFATISCLVASMSNTGLIAFFLASTLILFLGQSKTSSLGMTLVVGTILCILFLFYEELSSQEVIATMLDRVENNSAESRFAKFDNLYSIDSILKILIGDGGTVLYNNEIFKPHIGHLHFLLNYGFISYLIFIFLIFRIRSSLPLADYIPVFVLFIGFSANTGFIDFRFSSLAAAIIALYAKKDVKADF